MLCLMTGAPTPPSGRRGLSSTWAVVALVAGLALGLLGHSLGWSGFQLLAGALKPIGQLWISALQRFTGGANEIQRTIIAERGLGLPRG